MREVEISIPLNELEKDDQIYYMGKQIPQPFPVDLASFALFVFIDEEGGGPRVVLRPRR
jgi:hypothetical protein